MNATTVLVLLASGLASAGGARLLARGRAASRSWQATIAEHHAASGDYPTVADWRAGRLATRAVELEDTQEFDPITDDDPVTVTVTVVDDVPGALPGGAR